jgi:hypothetical protein
MAMNPATNSANEPGSGTAAMLNAAGWLKTNSAMKSL